MTDTENRLRGAFGNFRESLKGIVGTEVTLTIIAEVEGAKFEQLQLNCPTFKIDDEFEGLLFPSVCVTEPIDESDSFGGNDTFSFFEKIEVEEPE